MIIDQTTVEPKVLSEKVSRKILGTGGSLMMVEVIFKKGGVGEVHAHDTHEQVSYIVGAALRSSWERINESFPPETAFMPG
jgi:quercetin dioxygenase-like cupin family protein